MVRKGIPVLRKNYKEPVAVSFNTKRGQTIFTTQVNVGKPIKVNFKTKGKESKTITG